MIRRSFYGKGKNMGGFLVHVCAVGLVTLLFAFCPVELVQAKGDVLEEIVSRGSMNIATILSAPPFAFRDKQGKPAGFEIDLVKLLGEKLEVEIKIHDYDPAGCIPALLTRKVDVVASRYSNTYPRATKIVFTHPWFITGTYIGCKIDAPYESAFDLNQKGIKIACCEACVSIDAVEARLPKAKVVTYPSDIDLVEAVRTGRADAFANDELIVLSQVKAHPGELKSLSGNLQPDQYAYMVRADVESIHLKEFLNMFFMKIMVSGEYAVIYEKWIGKPWKPSWELHPGM
jgi:polar amino acid transport system substrate-binding protein